MNHLFLSLFTIIFSSLTYANSPVQVTVSGAQTGRMPLTIMVLDKTNKELLDVAAVIKKDLQFTDQFTVSIQSFSADIPKKELKQYLKNSSLSIPLTLCLNAPNKKSIEWRLYDSMQATLLAGKKYKKQGTVLRGWAHAIADNALQSLTGNEGFFSSRIAYCKDMSNAEGKKIRHIYIADFDGSNPELLIKTSAITVAPRWNIDQKNPAIFYSEYADTNVRLMSIDMKKNTKIASNLNGINMLASFSPDGKSVIYCASNGDGNCQLYLQTKGKLQSFTRNNGNNVSPVFLDEERICFCSDAQTGSPQIYIGNIKTGHVKRITKGGYCTSPAYCQKNNTIAYHAKLNNVMQICLYDCTTKTHTQITKDAKNKHEASWAPDGTHMIFAQEDKGKSRIALLNIATNAIKYITPISDYCSYPHWSGYYTHFPVIL